MFASQALSWTDVGDAVGLGLITLLRVVVLMILASLIWVPIGVWLGLRPVWARRAQPIAQFLAAFPANLLFPPFVLTIVYFHLKSRHLAHAADGARHTMVHPVQRGRRRRCLSRRPEGGRGQFPHRRLAVVAQSDHSGDLPYYITGAITASGGSWNAAIVAEVASWGDTKLQAHGLGAYIADATDKGDMARVVLGVVVMSAFVVLFNRLLWRPCTPSPNAA